MYFEKVYQEIKNKVDIKFKLIGTKKLKNISEKINIYMSSLSADDKETLKVKFNSKKIIFTSAVLVSVCFSVALIYKYFYSERINYNQNAKSVIESLNNSESELQSLSTPGDENILKISVMDFQIQSSNFNKEKLNILMDKIASSLSEERFSLNSKIS